MAWRADEYSNSPQGRSYFQILDADGALIADLGDAETSNEAVNARLIAAAPELLEALERITNEPCDHGPQNFCPREIAQAAIAKARGIRIHEAEIDFSTNESHVRPATENKFSSDS